MPGKVSHTGRNELKVFPVYREQTRQPQARSGNDDQRRHAGWHGEGSEQVRTGVEREGDRHKTERDARGREAVLRCVLFHVHVVLIRAAP